MELNYFLFIQFVVPDPADEDLGHELFMLLLPKRIVQVFMQEKIIHPKNDFDISTDGYLDANVSINDKNKLDAFIKIIKYNTNLNLENIKFDEIHIWGTNLYGGYLRNEYNYRYPIGDIKEENNFLYLFGELEYKNGVFTNNFLKLTEQDNSDLLQVYGKITGKNYGLFSQRKGIWVNNNGYNFFEIMNPLLWRCISAYNIYTQELQYSYIIQDNFRLLLPFIQQNIGDENFSNRYKIQENDCAIINELLMSNFIFDFKQNEYYFECFQHNSSVVFSLSELKKLLK